jgi:GNAT superfamily N-acetyltransferase
LPTNGDISIREARPEDAPLIARFIHELAEYERASDRCHATPELVREALFPVAGRPRAECLIGAIDGEDQGFAVFFHNFSTWHARAGMYLEDLFVRPAARGRGLGKALFCRVARIAVERGCARYEWNVLDWNTPALEFYRSMGAVALSEWTVHRLEGEALARVAALDKPAP